MSEPTVRLTQRRRLVTENFPVSILFGAQYGALVVVPAIIHDTSPLSLLITICAVGIGTAFAVEAFRSPLGARNARSIPVSPKAAMWIVSIGWLAAIGASITKGVAYIDQTTNAAPSHLAAFFTPLTYWLITGTVLVMAQAAGGAVSRKRASLVVLCGFTVELAVSLRAEILSDVVSYFIVVTFIAITLRLIQWRWVLIALFTLPVILPALYNLKTHERSASSQITEPGQQLNYGQRLRLDLEMAQVKDFATIPATNIDAPDLATLLQFGLIPRVFEQGRGTIHTGENLSVALGGSPTSSDSATTFGDAYLVDGWAGIVTYSGLAALATGIVIRRQGPWAYALLATITQNCLLVESGYPDMLAGLLQACVSLIVAILIVQAFSQRAIHQRLLTRPIYATRAGIARNIDEWG
jgi:hypothetical protein